MPTRQPRDVQQATLLFDAAGKVGLRVALASTHLPLLEVPAAITREGLLKTLRVVDADLPLWSVSFVDPGLAAFYGAGPEEYVVAFAFLRSKTPWVSSTLPWIVHDSGAWLLDEDLALREWDQRFRTMRIRDRIPSLVPAEVVVPLAALAEQVRLGHAAVLVTDLAMARSPVVAHHRDVADELEARVVDRHQDHARPGIGRGVGIGDSRRLADAAERRADGRRQQPVQDHSGDE